MRGQVVALGLLNLGLALLLPASPVRADYLVSPTQTQSFGLIQTDIFPFPSSPGKPGTPALLGKDPFTITQFDASKVMPPAPPGMVAVLEGVTVSLQYQFVSTIQLTFTSAATQTAGVSAIMHVGLNGANHDPNNANPDVANIVNAPTITNIKTLSAPDQVPIGTNYIDTPKVVSGTSAMFYSDANTLSLFTGTGKIPVAVGATAMTLLPNSQANGASGVNTFVSAALSVTYYYNFVVPEPSSFVMMGLGATGLCVVSRLRNRRKSCAAA